MQNEPNSTHRAPANQVRSNRAFVCRQCGQCCREPGYVYLTDQDIDAIAEFLELDVHTFTERFTRLAPERRRLSLNEKADASCIFLNAHGHCAIQTVKPEQCRCFPYDWRYSNMRAICEGWRNQVSCHENGNHTDRR